MSEIVPSVFEFSQDIKDAQPPVPLPIGEYQAEVREAEIRNSKSSGKPMLAVTYHVGAEQYPADYVDGNPDGEIMSAFLPLSDTPRSRYQTKRFAEMHGVVPSARVSPTEYIGAKVILQITHDEYQGQPTVRATPVREA